MVKKWPSSSLQAPNSVAFLGMVPLVPLPRPPRPRPARPPSLPPFPRPALAARAISLTLEAHKTTLLWLHVRRFLNAHTPDTSPVPASLLFFVPDRLVDLDLRLRRTCRPKSLLPADLYTLIFVSVLEEFTRAAPDTRIRRYFTLVLTRPQRPGWCFGVTVLFLV